MWKLAQTHQLFTNPKSVTKGRWNPVTRNIKPKRSHIKGIKRMSASNGIGYDRRKFLALQSAHPLRSFPVVTILACATCKRSSEVPLRMTVVNKPPETETDNSLFRADLAKGLSVLVVISKMGVSTFIVIGCSCIKWHRAP